jgi:hypothetical protein
MADISAADWPRITLHSPSDIGFVRQCHLRTQFPMLHLRSSMVLAMRLLRAPAGPFLCSATSLSH